MLTTIPAAGLPLMVTLPETVASAVLLSDLICEFARSHKAATHTRSAGAINARTGSFITFHQRGRGHHTQVRSICLTFCGSVLVWLCASLRLRVFCVRFTLRYDGFHAKAQSRKRKTAK